MYHGSAAVDRGSWMLFEWDERKREANLAKHLIDFEDARMVFDGPVFEKTYSRHGEDRILAIGLMQGIEIVVVYVMRGQRRRIISARRAHRHERQEYANRLRLADEGQD
jgi:uncharacterized DUF497 family protein